MKPKTQRKHTRVCNLARAVLSERPNTRFSARELYNAIAERNKNYAPRSPVALGFFLKYADPPIPYEWYNGRRFYFLEGTE